MPASQYVVLGQTLAVDDGDNERRVSNMAERRWRVGGLGVWLPRVLFVVVDVTVRKGKGVMLRNCIME